MNRFSLSQICLDLKQINDITRCLRTCYVVISCGGRKILYLTLGLISYISGVVF